MKNENREEKSNTKFNIEFIISKDGITLIALVVTIVILIILAGITLNLVLGSNGILTRAKEAKANYTNAAIEEENLLNSLATQIESYGGSGTTQLQVSQYKDSGTILSDTENTQITDDNGEAVTVPAGFKISSDSATDVNDGVVIEDADGNQYVWIPVASISDYARTDFGKQDGAYSNYSETIPSDEQTSVSTYKGYYIGRYEAGDKESTASKVMRSSSVTTDTVVIKKGQAPYNYVTRDQAITLAEGVDTVEGYTTATTKLCSSYAWDTAINFIQNKIAGYATTSTQGNYNDTTFSYTDITGVAKTKASSLNLLVPTGQTTPLCSIYDMGGNEAEWTTETSSAFPCVHRGGSSADGNSSCPAGYRYCFSTTLSSSLVAFRVTLYIM